MSNPYKPTYTSTQTALVERERKRLGERWSGDEFKKDQPRTFIIQFSHEELDGERLVDVFEARSASSSFSDTWRRETDSHSFSIEHGSRSFSVRVPHAYYLAQRRLPITVDASCLALTSVQTIGALLLVGAAYSLASE